MGIRSFLRRLIPAGGGEGPRVLARRYEHWVGPAVPLPSVDELLWLQPVDTPRVLAIDPQTGGRRIDRVGDPPPHDPPEVDAAYDAEADVVRVLREGACVHEVSVHRGGTVATSTSQRDLAVVSYLPHPDAEGTVTVITVAHWTGRAYVDRRFALCTAGHPTVVLTPGYVAIADGLDVVWVPRSDLTDADDVDTSVSIVEVETTPPAASEHATVDFVGATTGLGFVRSEARGRLRFDARDLPGLAKGDTLAIDVDAAGNVVRSWRPDCGAQPVPERLRTVRAGGWDLVARAAALAQQQHSIAAAEQRQRDTETNAIAAAQREREAQAAAQRAARERQRATHCTTVVYEVEVRTADGASLSDEDELRSLDGLTECTPDLMAHLTADECYDGVWLAGLVAGLWFDEAAEELRFAFEFHCEQAADRDAQRYLADVADRLLAECFGEGPAFEFAEPHVGARVTVRDPWIEIETRPITE